MIAERGGAAAMGGIGSLFSSGFLEIGKGAMNNLGSSQKSIVSFPMYVLYASAMLLLGRRGQGSAVKLVIFLVQVFLFCGVLVSLTQKKNIFCSHHGGGKSKKKQKKDHRGCFQIRERKEVNK